MRAWWAVTRSETAAFFNSAMAPLVVVVFLLLTGFAWVNALLDYAELSRSGLTSGQVLDANLNLFDGVFQPLAASVAAYLLLVLPAVTMRLLAEEFRSRRSDLILSWPVSDATWVLGKAAAAMSVALILLLGVLPAVVTTVWLGGAEIGPMLTSLLGLLGTAAVAVAWGVFFSGMASHQLVAWLLTFVFCMVLQNAAHAEPHLPAGLGALAQALSLPAHLERLTRGVLDLRDLVYFAGWTALGLTAATAQLTGRRLAGSRRGARWLPAVALTLLILAAFRVADRAPLRVDLTEDQRRSLAPQSVQVLETLRGEVRLTAFYQRLDPRRREMASLFEAFAVHSGDLVRTEMLNPDTDLGRVQEMGVTVSRTVVVESDGRRRSLPDPDEATLINAIFRVVEGRMPVVAYLQGHGEPDPQGEERDGYRAALEGIAREGYHVVPVLLNRDGLIAAEVDVVVIAGPDLDPTAAETAALHAFLARGGGVLALLDPGTPPGFEDFFLRYNVRADNAFVVGRPGAGGAVGSDPRVIVLGEYPRHELTRGLNGLPTFFPFAQPLSPAGGASPGLSARTVLKSGPDVWVETDPLQVRDGTMRYDEGEDRRGPVALGVAVEIDRAEFFAAERVSQLLGGDVESPAGSFLVETLRDLQRDEVSGEHNSVFLRNDPARLVVIGDSDFAANAQFQLYGNRDLLLNSVGWLTGEGELIGVRARPRSSQPLLLESAQTRLLGWAGTLGWPLLAGLGVAGRLFLRRRR